MVGMKLAIDFGSTNLTIFSESRGIVLCEPSLLIYDNFSGKPIAMGKKALAMRDRLPLSMREVVPIKDGSVNDYHAACIMLRSYLDRICAGKFLRPSVLMSVPGSVTPLEKKTLIDVITQAGAGRACFVDEALAAALGSGVGLREPKGFFVCDIGGGITDCAVISLGNIVVEKSIRIGGNDLTKAIRDYVFHTRGIEIGATTADEIKRTVGSAIFRTEELAILSTGKSCETGLPVVFEITSSEVYWVLKLYTDSVLDCIKSVLETSPVELLTDVSHGGILLSGGTANLFGLDRLIEWNIGLRTVRVDQPENCAALGMGLLWKHPEFLVQNGYTFISSEEENDD